MQKLVIFHVLTLDDLKNQTKDGYYKPVNFDDDGFIHCTGEKSTSLLVLEDYFCEISKTKEILILKIDLKKLTAKVKFENPSPIKGGGTNHLKEGIKFPHIYGGLNINAISGVGKVSKKENRFIWPQKFYNLNDIY